MLERSNWKLYTLEIVVFVAILVIALTNLEGFAPNNSASAKVSPAPAVVCDGAVQHPIEVRILALDPVERGQAMRAQVEVAAGQDLENTRVRLASAGGARIVGPAEAALGRIDADGRANATFAVTVPAVGHRTLLQFEVQGEGPAGVITRGATLNLLPDGPADPGTAVVTPDGRRLIHYNARRIN